MQNKLIQKKRPSGHLITDFPISRRPLSESLTEDLANLSFHLRCLTARKSLQRLFAGADLTTFVLCYQDTHE